MTKEQQEAWERWLAGRGVSPGETRENVSPEDAFTAGWIAGELIVEHYESHSADISDCWYCQRRRARGVQR